MLFYRCVALLDHALSNVVKASCLQDDLDTVELLLLSYTIEEQHALDYSGHAAIHVWSLSTLPSLSASDRRGFSGLYLFRGCLSSASWSVMMTQP
jgi:hypothetical protein